MSSPASSDVMPGDRIGRYTVLRRLATGGMAEIYLARHEGPMGFAKVVVIKRVLAGFQQTARFVEMFLDEGRLSARLSHPNIAQTFELGEHDGCFHIAMEYVPGESLARLVKRAVIDGRAIPPGSLLRIGIQVLEALDYAHDLKGERGEWLKVVHRDVSPTNVIITYHGGVKLLDFGIARAASHHHETQTGTVKGKGGYMSPEQAIAGPVDQRTDVYAAGALLYLLSTGVGPFDDAGDVFAMMQAAVEARFPKPSERNRGVDSKLEEIILKAMATRPADRYASAGEMLGQLEHYAAAQRVFPGSRELAALMRQLFPEQAELARSYDQAPDAAVVAKLAESFVELGGDEAVSAPTRFARRPASAPGEVPAPAAIQPLPGASSTGSNGTESTVVPSAPTRPNPPQGQPKTPTGQRPIAHPAPSSRMSRASDRTPLHGAALRSASARELGQTEDRTMRVPSITDGGPVPMIELGARPTTVAGPAFLLAHDDKTVAGPDDQARPREPTTIASGSERFPAPRSARTISAEQSLSATLSEDEPVQSEETVDHTESPVPISYQSVADIVSRNPWAFVGAGLGAVLLGVLLLWVLGN